MKFEKYLQVKKKKIDKQIKKTIAVWQNDVLTNVPEVKKLSDILLESNQGGKNIRGALVHLGYDLFAEKKLPEINTIAAAYEILQTSLLIHDDVIDKSVLRR